jgi:hypothetical protein
MSHPSSIAHMAPLLPRRGIRLQQGGRSTSFLWRARPLSEGLVLCTTKTPAKRFSQTTLPGVSLGSLPTPSGASRAGRMAGRNFTAGQHCREDGIAGCTRLPPEGGSRDPHEALGEPATPVHVGGGPLREQVQERGLVPSLQQQRHNRQHGSGPFQSLRAGVGFLGQGFCSERVRGRSQAPQQQCQAALS